MDELKAVIRSILTSTTTTLSVQQLSKDYRNTIGGPVPYQKFGYNSLEHMMKCMPDVVVVRGSGPFAELIVVQSDKSAHVDQLVSKQKTTVKKKQNWCYNQRRNVSHLASYNKPAFVQTNKQIQHPSGQIRPLMSSVTQSPSGQIPPLMSSVTQSPPIGTFRPKEYLESHKSTPPNTVKQQPKPTSLPKKSPETPYKPQIPRQTSIQTSTQTKQKSRTLPELNQLHSNISSKQQNFELNKENLEKYQQQLNLSEVCSSNNNVNHKKLENKYNFKDDFKPSLESVERNIPYTVKYNLKTLIEKYPGGIWCAEVPAVYKKLFRSELRYQELGFRSLIELCSSLPSIFHYVRPSTGDFKLYCKNLPLPDNAEKIFTVASYQPGKNQEKPEALPSFDWKDIEYLLPQDIVTLGEEIPREFVPDTTEVNDDIEVGRGEVYDISKFWVYINNGTLDELMENLQDFYKAKAQQYLIPKNVIKEGLYCVLLFDEDYHRALIIKVIDEESVKVVFIDYGTTSKVSTSGLYFLYKSFKKLPAQAIRCRLANIQPLTRGGPWSNEATCRFSNLFVSYKSFTARIMRIDKKSMALDIYLWDKTGSLDNSYVNDQLVEEGFAIYTDQVTSSKVTYLKKVAELRVPHSNGYQRKC